MQMLSLRYKWQWHYLYAKDWKWENLVFYQLTEKQNVILSAFQLNYPV